MNLEELINGYYAPKKGNDLLIKLIEGKLNEQEQFGVPKIFVPSPLDIEAGKETSASYLEYTELLKNIKGNAPYLFQRLQRVNDFLTNPQKIIKKANIQRAFSSFLLIQEIRENLLNTDESVAGFQAETIMAQLIDGSKEANDGPVDIESQKVFEGGVQLKTISPGTKISGSFLQLLEYYLKKENYYYIIILKSKTEGIYTFYTFSMNFEQFLQRMELTGFLKEYKANVPRNNFNREKYEEFIRVLGDSFNPRTNDIFIPDLNNAPELKAGTKEEQIAYLKSRFEKLKFLEKNAKIIPNKETYKLSTQYALKQSFMNTVYGDKGPPTKNSYFTGELDLRSEKIISVRNIYKKSLTGKMFEVLDSIKASIETMNKYFSTREESVGNQTLDNLNTTTNKFDNYFLKKQETES